MNKKTLFVTSVALTLLVTAYASVESYSLKRVVKVGDESSMKFEASFKFQEQDVKVSGVNVEKVVKVTEKGFQTETLQKETKILFAGTPVNDGQEDPPATVTDYGFDNLVTKIGDTPGVEDTENYRMLLLQTVPAPEKAVAVGDKWSHDFAAMKVKIGGKDLQTRKAKGDYEAVAVETLFGKSCLKVKMSYKELEGEDPSSAEGTIWVEVVSGETYKISQVVKNAPIPGMPPLEVTFTSEKK